MERVRIHDRVVLPKSYDGVHGTVIKVDYNRAEGYPPYLIKLDKPYGREGYDCLYFHAHDLEEE